MVVEVVVVVYSVERILYMGRGGWSISRLDMKRRGFADPDDARLGLDGQDREGARVANDCLRGHKTVPWLMGIVASVGQSRAFFPGRDSLKPPAQKEVRVGVTESTGAVVPPRAGRVFPRILTLDTRHTPPLVSCRRISPGPCSRKQPKVKLLATASMQPTGMD